MPDFTPEIRLALKWVQTMAQGTAKIVTQVVDHPTTGRVAKSFFILEAGRQVLVNMPIDASLKKKLEDNSAVNLVFGCGTKKFFDVTS